LKIWIKQRENNSFLDVFRMQPYGRIETIFSYLRNKMAMKMATNAMKSDFMRGGVYFDSPRLHHKRTVILIESYRSFSLPKKPMIRAIFAFLLRKSSCGEAF